MLAMNLVTTDSKHVWGYQASGPQTTAANREPRKHYPQFPLERLAALYDDTIARRKGKSEKERSLNA